MTAHALQGDREKCLAAGMDDYISKPVRQRELAAVLERWLNSAQSPSSETQPPSSGGDAEETLDGRVLANLRALQDSDEPDIVTELIDLFLQDAPGQLTAIRQAIERGDAHALQRAAHSLKGSSANLGAKRLAALCLELEKKGRANVIDGVNGLVEQLETEFQRLRRALETERQTTPC
ncbi:MAG: sensor histidine kinase [Acidobacteria bacterium]|nr:MAG: sensor histidine kinase [Acidobacteriota bacterium]